MIFESSSTFSSCVCVNGGMRKGIALEIKSQIRRERILDMWSSLQSLTSVVVFYSTTDFTLLHTQKLGKRGKNKALTHAKKPTHAHTHAHTRTHARSTTTTHMNSLLKGQFHQHFMHHSLPVNLHCF